MERFEKAGGRFVRGRATITAPGEVTVSTSDGARVFRATRGIVLNPGTEPAIPPIDGLAGTPYWTNREAVAVEQVPDSLIVLGGGPVGCEFAQVFARFGATVTVIEMAARLLPGDEPEAGELLAAAFGAEAIRVRTGVSARQVSHESWAIGDVTGQGAFTHVSMYQARIAAADIVGRDGATADYRAVLRVTFTDPEVGAVGLTEAAARKRGLRIRIGMARIPSSARGWIHKVGNAGLIKLIEDTDRGVLVGARRRSPDDYLVPCTRSPNSDSAVWDGEGCGTSSPASTVLADHAPHPARSRDRSRRARGVPRSGCRY